MKQLFLFALLWTSLLAVTAFNAVRADDSIMEVEKLMHAMPDAMDHAAIAAKYSAEAQALEEKAAMQTRVAKQYASTHIPGGSSRSSHFAELWDKMADMYAQATAEARKIAQMEQELADMRGS